MYGSTLSQAALIYPEISPAAQGGAPNDNVYSFPLGTTFDTTDGPKAVEDLQIGDLVRDSSGEFRTIVWLREARSHAPNSLNNNLELPGRRTRFPGVRFVRGRPSDAIIQMMFADEPVAATPQFSSRQSKSDYLAQFSSSRRRGTQENESESPLAAE